MPGSNLGPADYDIRGMKVVDRVEDLSDDISDFRFRKMTTTTKSEEGYKTALAGFRTTDL